MLCLCVSANKFNCLKKGVTREPTSLICKVYKQGVLENKVLVLSVTTHIKLLQTGESV